MRPTRDSILRDTGYLSVYHLFYERQAGPT